MKARVKSCLIHVAEKIPSQLTKIQYLIFLHVRTMVLIQQKKIISPSNCRSSTVNVSTKDNFNFAQPELVYVYTDIIKPNLVGDSYVRLLTSLHFPSTTGYHRFDYPLYKPVEQSFIESISIRLVMKTGENVLFEESDIPCMVILHYKKRSSVQ